MLLLVFVAVDQQVDELAALVPEHNLMLVLDCDDILTAILLPVLHLIHSLHCT